MTLFLRTRLLCLLLVVQIAYPPQLLARGGGDHDELVARIRQQTSTANSNPESLFALHQTATPPTWDGLGSDQQRRLRRLLSDAERAIHLFERVEQGQLPDAALPELLRLSRRLQRDFADFVRHHYLAEGIPVEVAPRPLPQLLMELHDSFLSRLAPPLSADAKFDPTAASTTVHTLAILVGTPQLQLDLTLLAGALESGLSAKQVVAALPNLRDERGVIDLNKYERWVEQNWQRKIAKTYLDWLTKNRRALRSIVMADTMIDSQGRPTRRHSFSLQQRKILRSHGFWSAQAFDAHCAVAREQVGAAINFTISKIIADAFLSFADFTIQRSLDRQLLAHSPLPLLWHHMTNLVSGSMMVASLLSFGMSSQITKSLLLQHTAWAPTAARAEHEMMQRLMGGTKKAAALGLKDFVGIAGISSIPMGSAMIFTDAIFGILQHPDFQAALYLFKRRALFKSDFELFTKRILSETVFSTIGLGHIASSTVLFALGVPIANFLVFRTMGGILGRILGSAGGPVGSILAMAVVLVGMGLFEEFIFRPYMTKSRLTEIIEENRAQQRRVIEAALGNPGKIIADIDAMFTELAIEPEEEAWLVRDADGAPHWVSSRAELIAPFMEQTLFGVNPDFFATHGALRQSASGEVAALQLGELGDDEEGLATKLDEIRHPFLATPNYKKYLALLEAIPAIQSGRAMRQAMDNAAQGVKGFVAQDLAIAPLRQELPATSAALEALFAIRHSGALVLQSFEMYRAEESVFKMLKIEEQLRLERDKLLVPVQSSLENCAYAIGQEMVLLPLLHMVLLCTSSSDRKGCVMSRGYAAQFNSANAFRADLYDSWAQSYPAAVDFLLGLSSKQLEALYIYGELKRLGPNGDVLRIAMPQESNPAAEQIAQSVAADKPPLLDYLTSQSNALIGPITTRLNAEYKTKILAEAQDIAWYDNDRQLAKRREIVRADICRFQPSDCEATHLLKTAFLESTSKLAEAVDNNETNIWTLGLADKDTTWTSLMTSELAHTFGVIWDWLPQLVERFAARDERIRISNEEEADAFALIYNGIRQAERKRLRDRFIFFVSTEERLHWIGRYGLPDEVNSPESAIASRTAEEIALVDPHGVAWGASSGLGEILEMFEEDELRLRQRESEMEKFRREFEAEFGKPDFNDEKDGGIKDK